MKRYLIQGLRAGRRTWETVDDADSEDRALLQALKRARLGQARYRVWDSAGTREVWSGSGREASIERWRTARPSGLVGANRRRRAMHRRNPRLSKRMQPLRENTMRLGDAMKWGRRLLDAGVGVHLWDGSGWEVAIRPDDGYSTPSGRAARGGRRYLAQGAGLIKTWPITVTSPTLKAGVWLTPATISHFLAHRSAGVASNPRVCPNPLCRMWQVVYKRKGKKTLSTGFATEKDANTFADFLRRQGKKVYGVSCRETQRNPRLNPARGRRRPGTVKVWCRLCGEWSRAKGPYRVPKAGPQRGKPLCDLCYRGFRSARRGGSPWAKNPRRSMSVLMNAPVETNARKAHDEIAAAFLAGRAKKVGPRYWTDGRLLRVWGNLVAEKRNGSIVLHDAGWRTKLTQAVLNTVLEGAGRMGYPYGRIYQKKFGWYVGTGTKDVPWTGSLVLAKAAAAANPLTRREAARILRHAKSQTAIAGRRRNKYPMDAAFQAGIAEGETRVVYHHGPRSARGVAGRVSWRTARASLGLRRNAARTKRVSANPHAGLKGLMSNSDAKKAMRFA